MENNEEPINIVFYDELLDLSPLFAELALVPMSDREEHELVTHIDSVIHHELFDEILSALPQDRHEEFGVLFAQDPASGELWVYLEQHVPDIRQRLQKRVDGVTSKLKQTISEHLEPFA